MNRLSHSLVAHLFLVLLMQFALLPGQGRIRCMLGSAGLLSCCCAESCAVVPEGIEKPATTGHATGHDCCGHAKAHEQKLSGPEAFAVMTSSPGSASNADADDSSGGDRDGKPCSCNDEAEGHPFPVDFDKGSSDDDRGIGTLLALNLESRSDFRVAKRVALRIIPRARTGPPFYVWHQVYLI